MRIFLSIVLSSLLLLSCETEIEDFKVKNQSSAIVVYGEVNNLNGPYSVRINYTSGYSPYDVTQFIGLPVKKATVQIIDDLGNKTELTEIQNGFYRTSPLFKGVVNRSYQLKIKTADGLEIESSIEKLNTPPTISNVNYQFVDAEKVENMRIDLTAAIKDDKNTENYYFIKRQDFIEFITTCLPPPPPPAPPPPCYPKCWRAPLNTQPQLLDDFLINGKEIPVKLSSINVYDITNWVVQLKAYNVSKSLYSYWKKQEDQRTIGGGLFDKIPAQILGNLTCTNNSSQQVLGLFFVGGVTNQRLTIDRLKVIGDDKFQKIMNFVNFNNIRYEDTKLNNCQDAGFVPYNIGRTLPDF